MSVLKKVQFNYRFEQLFDQCMDEVKEALKTAKTQKDMDKILENYGFDIDDFSHYVCRKTDETMVLAKVNAHLQRSGDFLGKSRKHIQNHRR